MLAVTFGMILIPASVLVVWFAAPPIKVLITSVVEGWGTAIGLSGTALIIANSMPVIIPLFCVGIIIAGLIGIVKGGGRSV